MLKHGSFQTGLEGEKDGRKDMMTVFTVALIVFSVPGGSLIARRSAFQTVAFNEFCHSSDRGFPF